MCPDCPYEVNRPQSADGVLAWTILERLASQWRGVGFAPVGLDLTAALALARAAGGDMTAMAVLLPAALDGAAEGLHDKIKQQGGGDDNA